jgi:hypothetical protein
MEFLHLLGICPDTLSHTDILDIIILNYNDFQTIINNIKTIINK